MSTAFQIIMNAEYGFTLQIPEAWQEREPDLSNGPYEVSRFTSAVPGEWPPTGGGVFCPPPGDPHELAELNRRDLEKKGFAEFTLLDVTLRHREAVRLDFVKVADQSLRRSYFIPAGRRLFVIGMGVMAGRDPVVMEDVARSFDAIEDPVGIVVGSVDTTPPDFVLELLEQDFGYSPARARRTAVRVCAHGEEVVALVARGRAARIIADITGRARQSGYPLTCRVAAGG